MIKELVGIALKAHGVDKPTLQFAFEWLERFGYLELKSAKPGRDAPARFTQAAAKKRATVAVKKMQEAYELKGDGIVGERVVRAMRMKRCGCPDIVPQRLAADIMHLNGGGISPWGKRNLTYKFDKYITGFPKSVQEEQFNAACVAWSAVANSTLDLARKSETPDIILTVGRGRRDQFDGPSGTLGYTYLRRQWDTASRGPIPLWMDDDENWKRTAGNGIWLYLVYLHELGHNWMDLEHSRIGDALMAASYNPAVKAPVSPDDVERAIKQFGVSLGKAVDPATPEGNTISVIIPKGVGVEIKCESNPA